MGDDEPSVVEDLMTHETIEEIGKRLAERSTHVIRQSFNLAERLCQSVRNLDVFASQLSQQLHVMVAGHAKSCPVLHHIAGDLHGVEYTGATVYQVTDEDCPSSFRVSENRVAPHRVAFAGDVLVPQLFEQFLKFVGASVDIADDVKWSRLVPLIIPSMERSLSTSCCSIVSIYRRPLARSCSHERSTIYSGLPAVAVPMK